MTSSEGSSTDSEESWAMARRHAAFLNPIPPSVTTAVQVLWKNYNEAIVPGEEVAISPESYMAIRRVDKSAKLKTPLYFAATSLFPERFEQIKEDDSSKALLTILTPGLFASFLALVYIHRRLNRLCTAPEWETLSKEFVLNMELGYLVGSNITAIGAPLGALLGGVRYAALATFLIRSSDLYMRYRNRFKKKFDPQHEHTTWGCSHAQICAYLVKDLGFIKDIIEVSKVFKPSLGPDEKVSADMNVWRATLDWIDGIKDGFCPPQKSEFTKALDVPDHEVESLKRTTAKLLKEGSTFSWMLRSAGGDEKEETEPKEQ